MNRSRILFVTAGIAATIAPAAVACADIVEFYGGDFDGRDAVGNYTVTNASNVLVTDQRVYDDFAHSSTLSIAALFGNFLTNDAARTATAGYAFEIRSGVSSGNGGTLVASGSSSSGFSWTATGRTGFWLQEYRFDANIPDLNLAAGTYHLNIRPLITAPAGVNMFLSTTSGANGVGSPLNNSNAFLTYAGGSFALMADVFGAYDFSQGVTLVPLPAALAAGLPALLGIGVLAVRRRRLARGL